MFRINTGVIARGWSLWLALILLLSMCSPVLAQTAPDSAPAATPLELDFSSTDKTMSGSKITTPVNIQVGQSTVQVTNSSVLTPGEYAAAMQVLHTGQQSVILGDLGNAVGGQLNLTKVQSPIANLVIPQGVTAVNNFGLTNGALSISGNLTNAGTLYAVSTVSQITNANIFANNISNLQSGLITSILPQGGISGITGALSNLNLSLNAVNNIVNAGTISSAGSLSAIAGNSIINSSQGAVMQAMQNVNLQALSVFNAGSIIAQAGALNVATSTLTNQAMMQSVLGNINILNSVNPALGLNVLSSTGGVMEALNGSINFGVVDDMAKNPMTITGGTYVGNALNINSGEGALNVNVRDIQAPLDVVKAGFADVQVTDGTKGLNIVGFNITGDPNLSYTGAGPYTSGAFNSDGGFVNINTSSDLVNGSITFTGNINTTPAANGSGGSVTLNAGTSISILNIATNNRTTGSAGNITLTAKTGISTGTLDAMGLNNANGGTIALDSGTASFSLGSLRTASFDSVNTFGSGAPGNLTFKQSGATLTNPTISFANNAELELYGASATSTPSLQFTMGNANALDIVFTTNIGTGAAGNITITSPFALTIRDLKADSRGTAGNVQLTSAGAITSGACISASGLSSGNGGNIVLDSATGTFTIDELYARSQTDPYWPANGSMGPVGAGTGNGLPGTLVFKQSGATLGTPNISVLGPSNLEINLDGTSSSPTQGLSINIISSAAAIGLFGNYNKGTGGSGNFTITSPGPLTLYGVSTATASGVAGNATVSVAGNLTFNGEGIHASGTSGGNINVSTSAGGSINLGSDPLVTNGNATVSAAGALSNVGTISGSNISISTGSGTLTLPSAITGTTSVSLSSPGNMVSATVAAVVTPMLNLSVTAGSIGTSITPVTIPSNSVSANASGLVNITKGSAMVIAGDSSAGTSFAARTTAGVLTVGSVADISAGTTLGLTTTNGNIQMNGGTLTTTTGIITISVGGVANGLVSSGNNIVISAGDDINFTIGNNTISTVGAAAGGSVQLTAGTGTVGGAINGAGIAINTSGTGTGAGGGVAIQATNGATALISIGAITTNGAGATASGTNATNGAVSGVTLTSGGSLTVGTISSRNTTAGSIVDGGDVSLTVNTAGTFTIASIQTSGGLSSGDGGNVSVRNNGAGGITVNLSSSFPANATNGRGGNITLNAAGGGTPGPLTFTGGITLATSPSVSGAGGNITLSGSQITLGGGTLLLRAAGAGGGADGDISVTTTSTLAAGNITLGNVVANQVSVDSPTGNVTINSGNVLTIIDPVSVGRFNGGGNTIVFNASLTANNGIFLNSTSDISASIFNGGTTYFNAADQNPGSSAINPAGTFMYVANYGTANVSVVNITNNTFVMNINVGTNPVSLVINSAGTFVYVANASTNNVSVINTATNTVTAVIPVGTLPQGIGINPAGTRVYVPNYNSNTVSVINTATNTVVGTISTGAGTRPTNVVVTPNGAYAYVTYNVSNSVGVIDLSNNTVVATVPVGATPVGIAVNPAGTYVYAGNKGAGTVSVINTNSNEVVSTITVGAGPVGINFNPSGTFAYVANETAGTVSVINTRSNAVVATWAVGLAPQTVSIKPNGLGAYITNSSSPAAQGLSFVDLSGLLTSAGTISFTTTNGNIGSSTSPLITAAGTLAINAAGAAHDVYVSQTQAATLLSSSTTGIFNLIAAGTLTNSGTLSTTTGAIQLNTPNLINNGVITTASATVPAINVAYAANLTLDGPGSFTAPGAGTVNFITTSSQGQITLPGTANLTVTSGASILIQAKQVNLNQGGTLTGTGASAITLNTNGSANSLTISAATGATTDSITTTGGTIVITPTAGQSLIFAQSGAGTATINLTGGAVTTTTSGAGSTIINSGVTLLANNNLTMNANAATITNNGTIQSSNAAGSIVLQSTGALTFAGTGNVIESGGGVANIFVQGAGANALAFTGSQTFNAGAAGAVYFSSKATGGSITIAASTTETVASGSTLVVSTPLLRLLGTASSIVASGASNIFMDSGGGANGLTITAATGTTNNTISTNGGAFGIAPTAGQALTFAQSGAGTATINLNGGGVSTVTSGAGNTIVNSGVTLASNNSIAMNMNSAALTNNGTIQSSNAAGFVLLQSSGALTIGGTGNVTESGGGAASVIVQAAGANALAFTGSQTFNAGALGTVSFNAQATGASITVAASTTETIASGSALVVSTPSLRLLGTASNIAASGASAISLNSGGGANGLTITTPTGISNDTISTTGGTIAIAPTAGQTLTFAQSAAGTSTFNLTGGAVTTTTSGAGNTIVNVNILTAGNNLTVNSGNNINLTLAGGSINTSGVGSGGSVQLTAGTSTAGGSINGAGVAITTSGTGTGAGGGIALIANNGAAALINIGAITTNGAGATAGGTNATNGAVSGITLTSGSTITVGNISARNTTAGSVVAGGAVSFSINSAATLTVGSIIVDGGLTSGSGGTINLVNNGSGGITVNGGTTMSATTVNGTGGSITLDATAGATDGVINITAPFSMLVNPSTSGAGGTITLSGSQLAVAGGALTLNASGAATGNGGSISITTTGATADITVGAAAGNVVLSATGGSGGSVAGNGGSITLSAGRTLTVNPASLAAGPLGTNGNGASLTLTSGTAAAGNLAVTGSLSANGVGTGNGGTISLTSNSATAFTLDSGVLANGVNGLTVNKGASGTNDGSISMINNGGDVMVRQTLTGNNITLQTGAAGNGNINIYNNVTGTSTVNLTAGGAGNVLVYRAAPVVTSTGANAPGALVFNAGGTVAYSVDAANGNLLIINPVTNVVTGTIAIGANPAYLAVDSANNRAYVTKTGSNIVSVVNLGSNTVIGTITLSARANGIVVSPAGTKIFVATGEDKVTVVTTADFNTYVPGAPIVVDVSGTGVGTQNLTLDSTGAYLYIGNQTSQRVSIMSVATNAIIAGTGGATGALLVGSRPLGMAANGGFVYVTNYLSHDVYTINTATQSVSSQNGVTGISVGATSTPVSIAVSANGLTAYSANQTTNTVSVINLSTYQTVDTIALASAPTAITMSPDGSFMYVASAAGGSLTKITMPPLVTGGTVNLTSATGNIGTVAAPVRTAATTLVVTSGGNAFVEQAGNVSVGVSTVTGSFQLASSGTITNTGLITAGSLNWITNNKDITLGANFNITNAAAIYAIGSGNINWTAGMLTAGSVNLFSSYGNIGTFANQIRTTTPILRANTGGAGNVFINNTGNVSLMDSTAGGSFSLTNSVGTTITIAGRVVVPNTVGHNITIQTTGNNAANRINVQAKVIAGGTVTLTATGGTVSYLPQTGVSTQLSGTVAGVPNATAIALNAAGTFAYVTDSVNWPPTSGNVRVIDTATNLVVATISVGNNPEGVAITPDGNYLFVTNRFSDSVSVIDLQAGGTFRQVVATISLPAGSEPWGIAFNPAGASTQAYVTNAGTSTVSVLNWQTRTVTATITGLPVGVFASYPKGVAFNPAGTAAYVADQFNRQVTVINAGTNAITTNIAVGDGPFGIATGTVGATPFAYVSNISDNTVSVINLLTNTVVSTVNVGNNPVGVSLSPTGTFAYVVNQGSNTVSVINTSTNVVVATVPVGGLPKGMGNFVGNVGGNVRAFVANSSGSVSVLDPTPALVDPYLVVLNAANVGTLADPIGILTQHLEINATGDVYAKISGSTIIDASSVGGVLHLTADGDITTGGNISAGSVMLQTPLSLLVGNITSTSGNIILNGSSVDVSNLAQVTANSGGVYVQSASGPISVINSTMSYTGGVLQSLGMALPPSAVSVGTSAQSTLPVLDTGALPTSFASSAQLWAGIGTPIMTASALSAIDALSGTAGRAYSSTSTTATSMTGGPVLESDAPSDDNGSSTAPAQIALSGGIERSLNMTGGNASGAGTMSHGLRSTAIRANESTMAAIVKDAGADFTVSDQLIRLNKGDILVSCLKAVTIQSGRHTVQLNKGAVALVRVIGNRLAVANLFDRKDGGISLLIGNSRLLTVTLGEEIILGASTDDMSAVTNDGIARRSIKTVDVQDTSLVSSQISYMSVLQKSPLLQLVHFDDDSSSRSISTKVEKAAACLMQLTGARGPYKTGSSH